MAQELEFNGVSFLEHFSQLEDPRIERKKLYPLNEIFLVTLAATICGAERWEDLAISDWTFCASSYHSIMEFHRTIHLEEYFHLLIQKLLVSVLCNG